jgi:glyoxylase I family protein
MKIEHIAFNVDDPAALAQWYVERLNFVVKRSMVEAPFAHFIADEGGAVMIEVYRNPEFPVPNYKEQDPAIMHLALACEDVAAERQRLLDAGATAVGDVFTMETGDTFAMLRDPWDLPLQLVKRATPMV